MKVRDISLSPTTAAADLVGQPAQATPRVIAITSGRRGVGQSVVVVLLGLALSRLGKRVLVLDAALGQPAIHQLVGINPSFDIGEVLAGCRTLAEGIVASPCGLDILPLAQGQDNRELSQGDKLLLLQELEACAAGYDFVLVDTGPGLATHVLYFNLGAQERIVVADEEPASVIDAYTLIKVLATRHAEKRFQVLFTRIVRPEVVQRTYMQLVKVADRFLHGTISLGFLGTVPFDATIVEASLQQRPIVAVAALAPAGCACVQVARSLLVQEAHPALDGNMKFFWQSLHKRAVRAQHQGGYHAG